MKERLDVILVNQGYVPSREKAKAIIMSGNVYVNGQREDKAGTAFHTEEISVEVRGNSLKYVSRGGLKLEKAIEKWGLAPEGLICLDIGASTGGFTDCMLQNGAAKVYAVDVGRGQLAWKLRNDSRVVCMEQTNFRRLVKGDLPEEPDFAGADVSFISLTKILIPARNVLRPGGGMVCLIKPQFEAGREKVGKNGVVREPETHLEVIHRMVDYAACIGFEALHLDYSPIRGPEGNIEYLLHIRKAECIPEEILSLSEREAEERLEEIVRDKTGLSREDAWEQRIQETVEQSHEGGGSI
ncbi:MAG: TlyA family RNA methyltransferase [Clostridium sp.]|nr:TlyA family RNA methyltransferase [Acetatifactor muris]MCM1527014.1 TlyA family RNA methyltransferase [Bacteroides sp.]MCM1561990.1 TlyA family RNA methyltransferase [Clostridium sp.]